MYTCRECERPINQASEVCPYCGADLTISAEAAEAPLTPAARRKALIRRWVLWGVLVAGIWTFLWYVLPERPGDAAGEAEGRAVEALRLVGKALTEHQAAAGRLPDTLEALSGASFAEAREAAQRAQAMGYRLEYTPGPEENGAIRTYVLLARPNHFGYRNFWANESGSIRWTRENRPATAQDNPIETADERR
jgi:hypothetical protein